MTSHFAHVSQNLTQNCRTNRTYVAWKRNQAFDESYIEILEVAGDGMTFTNFSPTVLLRSSNDFFDNHCIEAPWFVYRFVQISVDATITTTWKL